MTGPLAAPLDRLVDRALVSELRDRRLAVGRTIIATAQLLTVLATSNASLFSSGVGPSGPRCDGGRLLALWCLLPGEGGMNAARVLTVLIFAAAAVGYRPAWTCVPHWYATFSLGTVAGPVDGGDMAARIVTLLLVPILVGDDRRWHWSPPHAGPPAADRGLGYAAHLALRAQVAVIYLQAGAAKLADPYWRRGTALSYWLHSHYWGVAPALRGWTYPLLATPWVARPMTWSVPVLEVGIAAAMPMAVSARRPAIAAAVALHGAIIVLMGLTSFGLIMIGTVAAACAGGPISPKVPESLHGSARRLFDAPPP